jgi:hypothetical protein
VQIAENMWTTVHAVAGAFLRVDGCVPSAVGYNATIRPAHCRGTFLNSDDLLNQIWDSSALTLRLCVQGLVPKRDRMPWAGDKALITLSNAYAFGTPPLFVGSRALGRPSTGFINGIVDYLLW